MKNYREELRPRMTEKEIEEMREFEKFIIETNKAEWQALQEDVYFIGWCDLENEKLERGNI